MKSNKLIILTLVTIVVILAATMMSRHRAPTTSLEKQLLFPALLDKVNDVSTVSLKKQEKSLTLVQKEKQWVIQDADNYPANFGKIRETVIALAELMLLAEKTSNSDLYEKLGVEDPSENHASSVQLSLLDSNGKALADLIVGNARRSKSPGDKSGLYVRLPDAQAALLVEGRLDISTDVTDWFERELFDINASRVKHIHIAHADDAIIELGRENEVDDFSMDNLPEGMEMQSNVIISRMGTMLESVFVDNVISADKLAEAEQSTATIHTFDGLIVTISSAEIGGNNYSSFSFAVDENVDKGSENESTEDTTTNSDNPGPAEEAEALNKLMSGWAYAIPSFKYELFTRKLDALIRASSTEDEASKEGADS
jgi:Domain of unknown function (DUF4340)